MKDFQFKGQNINPSWFNEQTEEAFVAHAVASNWCSEEEAKKAFTELNYQARMKALEDVPFEATSIKQVVTPEMINQAKADAYDALVEESQKEKKKRSRKTE